MGPKFFHVVRYEYLRVFLNTPFKNSTLWEMKKKKKNIYGSKVVLSGEPSKNKKKFKKIKYRTKNGSKMWFRTIFGSIKNLFWFSFLEPFQEV